MARHGANAAARRGALAALDQWADTSEILAVALNSDHKDVAVAAVDLLNERAQLEQIVARGIEQGRREARPRHLA